MQVESFIYYLWTNKNSATREERKRKRHLHRKSDAHRNSRGEVYDKVIRHRGESAMQDEVKSALTEMLTTAGGERRVLRRSPWEPEQKVLNCGGPDVRSEESSKKQQTSREGKKKEKWIWRRGKVTRHGEAKTQVGVYEMSVLSFGHWWHHHLWMLWKSR